MNNTENNYVSFLDGWCEFWRVAFQTERSLLSSVGFFTALTVLGVITGLVNKALKWLF